MRYQPRICKSLRSTSHQATGGLAALGMAAPASAARPYTKAPPAPVVAIYDWTGFYIGVSGGGGSAHECWDPFGRF
jgi:outer membrane immunogenic protein